MPDAYSFGSEEPVVRRRPPRRPLRVLLFVLVLVGLAYYLVFSPAAPFAPWGDRLRNTVSDVTDGLVGGDAAGSPDDIQARWEAEFGEGDAAEKTAGLTSARLFRNNMRGLRNAVRRDERDKIERWRLGIEKNFRTGRAWRAEHGAGQPTAPAD